MTPDRVDRAATNSLSPFTEDVYAIATHYGVPARDVEPAPSQGQVNLTVFLGAELVLRIPRNPRLLSN